VPESLSAEARGEAPAAHHALSLTAWRQVLFGPLGILFALTLVSTGGLMIFASVFGLYAFSRAPLSEKSFC
jgi:hypothetical protein